MERCTVKNEEGQYYLDNGTLSETFCKACNKFGKLEDIEEELSIDLPTLFNILKNGFWFKGQYGGLFKGFGMFDFKRLAIIMDEDDGDFSEFPLSELGKTWATTKEELLGE